MKFKRIIPVFVVLLIVIIAAFYTSHLYLYNPFNYPKGNLLDFSIGWSQFKKPIDVEALSWNNGKQTLYMPIENSTKEAKLIINGFAKSSKMKDYTMTDYLKQLPKDRGNEYTIFIRQVDDRTEEKSNGRILLQFNFYENSNIIEMDGVYFYTISNNFKGVILDMLKTEKAY